MVLFHIFHISFCLLTPPPLEENLDSRLHDTVLTQEDGFQSIVNILKFYNFFLLNYTPENRVS